jgi:hypothetical protein
MLKIGGSIGKRSDGEGKSAAFGRVPIEPVTGRESRRPCRIGIPEAFEEGNRLSGGISGRMK